MLFCPELPICGNGSPSIGKLILYPELPICRSGSVFMFLWEHLPFSAKVVKYSKNLSLYFAEIVFMQQSLKLGEAQIQFTCGKVPIFEDILPHLLYMLPRQLPLIGIH